MGAISIKSGLEDYIVKIQSEQLRLNCANNWITNVNRKEIPIGVLLIKFGLILKMPNNLTDLSRFTRF